MIASTYTTTNDYASGLTLNELLGAMALLKPVMQYRTSKHVQKTGKDGQPFCAAIPLVIWHDDGTMDIHPTEKVLYLHPDNEAWMKEQLGKQYRLINAP